MENELLQNTPEEIARFLYKGEGLNKTAIGDYLGERYGHHHSAPVGPAPPATCAQLLPSHRQLAGGTALQPPHREALADASSDWTVTEWTDTG